MDMLTQRQMKLKAVLLSTLLLFPASAVAQQRVYTESYCYENIEEYIPGYYNSYGRYVSGYVKTDRRRIPCGYGSYPQTSYPPQYIPPQPYYPRCNAARTTLGGLLGGGIAAALSKQDAYGWSIPLGAVLGLGAAQAGCQ
jgi:hypothetical protein